MPCASSQRNKWTGAKSEVSRTLRILLSIVWLVTVGHIFGSSAKAQVQNPSIEIPGMVLATGTPVAIEEADRILRARLPESSFSSLRSMAPQIERTQSAGPVETASLSSNTVGCNASSQQPVEIVTLAASLKCDIDLIFEYVYNNIDYEPLFGSNKGPLGTLLDLRGSDLDQAQLFTALLSAAGYSASQLTYNFGYIRLNDTGAAAWLGVKNDGFAAATVFLNGGIPINLGLSSDGKHVIFIDVAHVWVQVRIGETSYAFDPSFKSYAVSPGLANLAGVLGYTQNQFLTEAGGTIDSVSIANLNRNTVRNNLNTYANNLIDHIKRSNAGWALSDVVGGKEIQQLVGSPIRQLILPNLSPYQPPGFPQNWGGAVPNGYRTCFTISMPGIAPTQCGSASSQTIQLYADETYGRRITVFSIVSGSNFVPTLLIDGAPPPNGQNTGTAAPFGTKWNVNISIIHPYGSAFANQSGTLSISAGGSYLIGAGWGRVGRGMIEKHRALLSQARAAGNAPASEVVLGESLAIISYSWLAEYAAAHRLGDAIFKISTLYHHGVGIAGQAVVQANLQGPYVDLPFNTLSILPQTFYSGSGRDPTVIGSFYTYSGLSSSLESAVLEQTQALTAGVQAASTVRLIDQNAATSAKTYLADGTTTAGVAAYFGSIRPNLTSSYSTTDLTFVDCQISVTCASGGQPKGSQALLPANGNISVGLWHGTGFTVTVNTSSTLGILQKITGGLSGGFSGENITPSSVVDSTWQEMLPTPGDPAISPSFFANPPAPYGQTISDPVDAVTGANIYQHNDLTVGSGNFPYALSFDRTYRSSSSALDIGLGNGWTHSASIAVSRSSNPFAGLGQTSPISTAAAIAALYISQDLLSGATSAKTLTISWLVSRWLTDQLTNNSVQVSWPGTAEEFIMLPHTDGSTSVTYNPPPSSAVILTGSAPDQYGNFTTFTYRSKDQTQLTFNPINSAAAGQIASWTFPNGMNVNFAYSYTFNGTTYLSGVSNNLGRSLTLNYSGAHLTSVSDDAGRSVTYGYDGNNLARFTDPLFKTTVFAYDGPASHLTQVFYPSNPGSAFFTNVYDALGRVRQQTNANGNSSSFYFGGSRTEFVNQAGDRQITYQSPRGKIIKDMGVLSNSVGNVFNDTAQQNGLVNVTTNQYDGQDRLILTTAPEGGTIAYAYSLDLSHNVVQMTRAPKPNSPLSPLTTAYTYDPVYNKPISVTDPSGLITTMGYDGSTGNLLSTVVDAGSSPHFNARTTFTYNSRGQVVTETDPLGTITQSGYDSRGNRTSITRDYGGGRINQVTTMGYSSLGDVTSLTDANGKITVSTYDASRRLISVTSPGTAAAAGGVITTFKYDSDGRAIGTQQSANNTVLRTTGSTYSLTGQQTTTTDANGNVTLYNYDAVDRLSSITDAMGRVTSYAYDTLGRRTKVFNTAIQAAPLLQQDYTPDGLLANLTDANNNTTNYAYDGFDRLTTTTYPVGSTEKLSYDANSNVLTRKTRKGDTIAFAYDTLNRLVTKTPPAPGAIVNYAYDLANRLTSISDNSIAMTSAVPPAPDTAVQYAASYTYDSLNRPTTVTWNPASATAIPPRSGVTFNHAYNKANQRVGQTATDNSWLNYPTATPSLVNYTANALNQYTAVGAITPSYDGNGNLISDGTFTFGYDAENRLISASDAGNTVSYAFDAQGRRKTKVVNGTTTVFVTDADNREVLEYDGSSGSILRWYAYGLGTNDVLNQMNVDAATRATLIPDIQGSIIASMDSSSGLLSKFGYLPYGKSASIPASFGYTGQRVDAETNGLYYYRARHYSPILGRFMQPDPIGYSGGINHYAYVGNNPLNLIDPFGLSPDSPSGVNASNSYAVSDVFTAPTTTFQLAAASVDELARAAGGRPDLNFGGGGGSVPLIKAPSPGSASSSGTAPNFIVSPGGTAYPVPQGAIGPVPSNTGTGIQFQGGSGGPSLDPRVTGFRFMDSPANAPYQYQNGYGVYNNITGQTVNPSTGRTVPYSDPWAHIPAR